MMYQKIPPKAGRLGSGAYHAISPIKGDPFGKASTKNVKAPVAGSGGLENAYRPSPASGFYGNPLANNRDTATQVHHPPVTTWNNVHYYPSISGHRVGPPEITPTERGSFFRAKVVPVSKTQFGATGEKTSDTAFHPHPAKPLPRPIVRSQVQTVRLVLPSIGTTGNFWNDKNNSFYQGRPSVTTGRTGAGRWNVTKKGAV